MLARGKRVDYKKTERELHVRDRQDREREIAPLMASQDAIIIDSTNIGVSEVVDQLMSIIKKHPRYDSSQ